MILAPVRACSDKAVCIRTSESPPAPGDRRRNFFARTNTPIKNYFISSTRFLSTILRGRAPGLGLRLRVNYPASVPMILECERCTACCRWPGQVCLSEPEIRRLAAFKGLSETDFIQQFTRLRPDRRGLALTEQPDGACIFLTGDGCAVQAVKPQQCRDFPNLWVNSLWGKMPLAEIRHQYPMLANCAAFKTFLNAARSELDFRSEAK